MDTKALRRVEVKDADRGEVTAVFATLDVVDHDLDVTVPGAFTDGAAVRISAYGHASWHGSLPVGKGTIREVGREAVLEGRFFLDTAAGVDTFRVVKELGELQEWSYGYDPVEWSYGDHHDGQRVRFLRRLKVHEVSPVLLGAGVGTRTIGAKGGALKFTDEAEQVVALLAGLVERTADVMAMRREKGKGLGATTAGLLTQVKGHADRLAELLATPDPDPTDPGVDDLQAALLREYLRSLRRTA